jgi:8-oxo-dGTP pyrophosphatase MutT (NUDIX family)
MVKRNEASRVMPGFWVFPGGTIDPDDGPDEDGRRACGLRELREETGIELAGPEDLIPYSRWITPEEVPWRFDTWFYTAMAPGHQKPEPDGEEMTDALWIAPPTALHRHRGGEMSLAFPTIKHLESLLGFGSADEVLEAARSRTLQPVQPRVVGEGEGRRIVLPGEPGYED